MEKIMPTVLITGANRGLGLEYARQYAAEDWQVIATARDPENAHELNVLDNTEVIALDVADQGSIDNLGKALEDRALTHVISNAGVFGPHKQTFADMDYEGWHKMLRVNTLAPMHLAKVVLPNLLAAKEASEKGYEVPKLAFMSSRLGSIAEFEGGGYYAYNSSKAALNMVAHGIAAQLKPQGIVTLILHPGWVQTDMGGPGAPLKPQESITGLRKVIMGATLDQTGKFLDYQGKELPW